MFPFALHRNARAAHRSAYPFARVLSVAAARSARAQIARCPLYQATPLVELRGIARMCAVESVHYKDESARFGLGSFKALGGAYAVAQLLAQKVSLLRGRDVQIEELARGLHEELTSEITVTCATDGNHGRSVAAAARVFRCKCVIFLHEGVSAGREAAISALGAEVVRVSGTYDDSVRAAARTAAAEGWEIVSDTSWPGYETTPAMVMQGYTVMVLEVLEQLHAMGSRMPTHVFLQGGVGGLAAGVVAHMWEELGPESAPVFIVVEPDRADCLFQSALAGRPAPAKGALDTIMAGLACGEVSALAWPILHAAAEYFMTIPDDAAIEGMRLLARGAYGDVPIVAGESATAGLAGLLCVTGSSAAREQCADLRLGEQARVLLFGTEGATDPQLYSRLINDHISLSGLREVTA